MQHPLPSPELFWPRPPFSGNLVPASSNYDGSGEFLLSVTAGAIYVWTGTGGEAAFDGAQPLTSAESFIAQNNSLRLTGPATATVLAEVLHQTR